MSEQRMISVGDFLTQEQAKAAIVLWAKHGGRKGNGTFVNALVSEIIEPNLAEINRKLGQENNARFLAYAVEHVLIQASDGQ